MTTLTVSRRDTAEFQLTFTDVNGDVVDLTGGTVYFTAKKKLYDADDEAIFSKEITSFSTPTTGVCTVSLTAADTNQVPRTYYYDVQLVLASKVMSSLRGKLNIVQDVTIRVS